MNDLAQRKQALDITQSFIVQAPAGSGKTELLTQRYLKLLSVCENPENIMAMTFTNKAVDELNERVLSALKSSQQPLPKQPHKQITYKLAADVMARSADKNWQLLQNPKRLKISTLDGLSSLIASAHPTPAQWVPRQIMLQQWQHNQAYLHAAEQTLLMVEDAKYGESVATLLLYLDNKVERFYRLMTQMLSKRDQWLTRLYRGDALDVESLKNSAKQIVSQHLFDLEKAAKPHLNTRFFELLQANTQPQYMAIKTLPDAQISALPRWQDLADLLFQGGVYKKNQWRQSVNIKNGFPPEAKAQKLEFLQFLTALEGKDNFRDLLFGTLNLPEIDFSQMQVEALKTITQVLKLCTAQLNLYFQKQQAHDFIQVALDANQALDERTNISDVALFLDYKVQHLLVDEFQDTSTSQFNTIIGLVKHWQVNDGKTLFLVGDPMQSIYRFRESQVGLFLQVKARGIANIKPISLVLSTNFRSSKSIVEANNRFFQRIFPAIEDIYQGAITHSPSIAATDLVDDEAVVFHPFAQQQFASEAQTVVDIVQKQLRDYPTSEVAILVRSRTHLSEIAPQLKQQNVAFESLKITPLKDHLLTRDLFSLTKALLHLGDKLAWLSLLRSPWCGLILDDLLLLSKNDKHTIYQQLSDETVLLKLSEDGRKRATHLHNCMIDALNHAGRFSFVELLTHSLNQLNVGALLSASEQLIMTQFLQIIHQCEKQKKLNIDNIRLALAGLYAPSETAQVKLMTVHQSKGLEFDCVIIPGLGKKSRASTAPIMHIKEFSDQSLLLAPIKSATQTSESQTYGYLKFIESQQNKFETERLLYVAMTRAKNRLHLLGALNASNRADSSSFLALLMPFYTDRFSELAITEPSSDATMQKPEPPLLSRLEKLKTPTNRPQKTGEMIQYQPNFERLFKSALGTLVHQYYQQENFSPNTQNLNARLIEIGTPLRQVDKYCTWITSLLTNTKLDVKFDWLFKPRASTLTEVEFINQEKLIVIDRLFIDEGVLWIIDFKTAELKPNETIADFVKRQQSQHQQQLSFYQQTLAQIYDNPIQCALYCPAVQRLIEISVD